MKNTGITRKIDELGRIVLPIEIRRRLNVNERDSLEFYMDGDKCIFKKYQPSCVFCGSTINNVSFKEKLICGECLQLLSEKRD